VATSGGGGKVEIRSSDRPSAKVQAIKGTGQERGGGENLVMREGESGS